MPIRFRKSLSLGKGLRLNFSKRGMSMSQKIGNVTLNSGGRVTANIPGTGISAYTQASKARGKNQVSVQMWVSLIVGFIFIMCCICFGFYALLNPSVNNSSTPTPTSLDTKLLPVIISTDTFAPLFTPTSSMTPLPPPTLAPTWTPEPTYTPFVLPTLQIINPPANTGCSCNSDTYNCSDFSNQSSAQACFNTCVAEGKGDIHRLDQNNDGVACESN